VLEATPPAVPSVRSPLGPVAARGPTWWPPPSGARRRTTASAGHSLPAAAECRADGGGGAQGRSGAAEPDLDARVEGRGRRLTPWAAAAAALVRARPPGPVLYACTTTTVGERKRGRERDEGRE